MKWGQLNKSGDNFIKKNVEKKKKFYLNIHKTMYT